MIRVDLEAHAAACREAMAAGRERPRWVGESLFGANLAGADLTKADLSGANIVRAKLSGAKLSGAETDEAGRGWLDLYSDAACVGVGLEVEPHPGGKVWVVRTAPPLPA